MYCQPKPLFRVAEFQPNPNPPALRNLEFCHSFVYLLTRNFEKRRLSSTSGLIISIHTQDTLNGTAFNYCIELPLVQVNPGLNDFCFCSKYMATQKLSFFRNAQF
ncbi:uncharacterized protein EAF01_002062 [Botrytis porri]|uniref:uncharacterized protein n=1 Tax=Botrytis porri TaxID=87229 RepID=UPI0019008CA9|nr:uncharacterized protein EAF01_002062 [Botrytis porri]KAF7913041.1 hypothetical protein EAF01_002062 [Botrytis porri]